MENQSTNKVIAWAVLGLLMILGVGVTVSATGERLQFFLGLAVGILGNTLSTAVWDIFIKPAISGRSDDTKKIYKAIESLKFGLDDKNVLARVHLRSDTIMNDDISRAAIRIAQQAAQYWVLAASGNVASFRLAELARKKHPKGTRVTFVIGDPDTFKDDAEKIMATLGFLAEYVAAMGQWTPSEAIEVRVCFSTLPIIWHIEFGGELGVGGLFAFDHGRTSRRYYEFPSGAHLAAECDHLLLEYATEAEKAGRILTMRSGKGLKASDCLKEAVARMNHVTVPSFLESENITKAAAAKRPSMEAMRVFPPGF